MSLEERLNQRLAALRYWTGAEDEIRRMPPIPEGLDEEADKIVRLWIDWPYLPPPADPMMRRLIAIRAAVAGMQLAFLASDGAPVETLIEDARAPDLSTLLNLLLIEMWPVYRMSWSNPDDFRN